ncbi:MAG: hypothetical protein WCH44_13240 [Betaproteobacteria bacterium]
MNSGMASTKKKEKPNSNGHTSSFQNVSSSSSSWAGSRARAFQKCIFMFDLVGAFNPAKSTTERVGTRCHCQAFSRGRECFAP